MPPTDASTHPLTPFIERYVTAEPAAAARALEGLTESEACGVFKALPTSVASLILPHLQVSFAAVLVQEMDPRGFAAVMRTAEPKRAASILMRLSPEALGRLLPHAPKKIKEEARALMIYPEDSVGRIMSTDYLAFHAGDRVRDAVRKIRNLAAQRYPASYAYVVDSEEHLLGVINMRDLLIAAEDDSLESVARQDVFSLDSYLDCAEAAEQLGKRRYFAAPVVDNENHLLGVVRAEQLLHGVQQDVAESIQRMFGGSPDERAFSPMTFKLRKRLPWLHVNLATAFLAAYVVSLFEETIAKITVLAVFLPVVAGQGGNAGAQSLAIVMRGLVMREIPRDRITALIVKESLLGLTTGAAIGCVTGVIAWLWQGNAVLGVVIGLGMIVNLFAAGLAGAAIPLVMRKLGFDPAQCSSIILTTVTDVVGFVAFLGFAVLLQNHLV